MTDKQDFASSVKRWDVFEIVLHGPAEGNPFIDQSLTGIFSGKNESVTVEGFYDGDGVYKIRFMPSFAGRYHFVLRASFLDTALSGAFIVEEADEKNHGPVRKAGTFHFSYEDGTKYVPMGTTAYVWWLQDDETVSETLESLKASGFNKVRFCVFPKHYFYNLKDPVLFPYEGKAMDASVLNDDNMLAYMGKSEGNDFDFHRFNPAYFQRLEKCVAELGEAGIEADLILFHPYDRWGFSKMSREEDTFYLKYLINRLSAYHNVWWSLANEWDLVAGKSIADWEALASVLVKKDVNHHLRSIHNCREIYDQTRPWITHVSMQRVDLYKGAELTDTYREMYQKPVVMEELGYEGDLPFGWGNLTAEEETRRMWETAMRGGYPTHGETFLADKDHIWWAHGGRLQGESWKRAAFLRKILEEVPGTGLMRIENEWDSIEAVPESEWAQNNKSQYLFYYSFMRPSYRDYSVDADTDYVAEIIDTYDMTVRKAGIYHGSFRLALPAKPYICVRLRKAEVADYDLDEPVEEIEEKKEVYVSPTAETEKIETVKPVIEEETEEETTESIPVEENTEAETEVPAEVSEEAEERTEETAEAETEDKMETPDFPPEPAVDDVPDFLNMPVEESGNDDTTEVPIFANNAANEAAEKETETSEEEEAEEEKPEEDVVDPFADYRFQGEEDPGATEVLQLGDVLDELTSGGDVDDPMAAITRNYTHDEKAETEDDVEAALDAEETEEEPVEEVKPQKKPERVFDPSLYRNPGIDYIKLDPIRPEAEPAEEEVQVDTEAPAEEAEEEIVIETQETEEEKEPAEVSVSAEEEEKPADDEPVAAEPILNIAEEEPEETEAESDTETEPEEIAAETEKPAEQVEESAEEKPEEKTEEDAEMPPFTFLEEDDDELPEIITGIPDHRK